MPIKINNVQFKDYLDRTGNTLKGNAGDYIKEVQVDFIINYRISLNPSVAVKLEGVELTLLSGQWSDHGYVVGAGIDITDFGTPGTQSKTITAINGAVLTIDTVTTFTDAVYQSGKVTMTKFTEEIEMFYNLSDTSNPNNEFSTLDSEVQRFRVQTVDTMSVTDVRAMLQLGNKSGGSEMNMTIERLADVSGFRQFRIVTPFKIWQVLNRDLYDAAGTINPFFKIIAYADANFKKTKLEIREFRVGDVGYVNENYNGVPANYTFNSITWTDDSGDPLDTLDYRQNSNFSIRIDGTFNANHRFSPFLYNAPDTASIYSNLSTPFENNLMIATSLTPINYGVPTNLTGAKRANNAGWDIQAFDVTNNTTHVIITGKVVPTTELKDEFDGRSLDDRRYRLTIKVEDSSLSYLASDAVNVLCANDIAAKVPIPLGAWGAVSSIDIIDHNNVTLATNPITEDNLQTTVRFTLPKNSEVVTAIRPSVVAVNSVTGDEFTLEDETFRFRPNVFSFDGKRPMNQTIDRGFEMPLAAGRVNATAKHYPALDDASNFGLEVVYPFRMDWRYWRKLLVAQPFFGQFNKEWQHYSADANWDLFFRLNLETEDGTYQNDSTLFDDRDYDDWTGTSNITFKRLDGTPITKPIKGELTHVIATHILSGGNTWNGSEWGEITVEQFEADPRFLISTVYAHGGDVENPLIPLTGETELKKTVAGATVTFECLFDPDKAARATKVSFTSRINGSTVSAGTQSNRVKQTFNVGKKPLTLDTEERGTKECTKPFQVHADLTSTTTYKNDVTSRAVLGDSAVFTLTREDEAPVTYVAPSLAFVNDANAWYTTINWRDVASMDGWGCYILTATATTAGIDTEVLFGTFNVMPYAVGTEILAKNTVRIDSIFNDVNVKEGIDYTGTFVRDTLRINGKFGYFQPNTEVDNIQFQDNTMAKIKREDLFDYELRVDLHGRLHIERLLTHIRGENECWITDHNVEVFKQYIEIPVIVKEGFKVGHFDGTRRVKGVAKFEDRTRDSFTHYQDNTASGKPATPPNIAIDSTVENSDASYQETVASGQTLVLPDTQYDIYVNGVFDQSVTLVTLKNETINISA